MLQTDEDEEETGPSVDSTNPDERILARRLRIQQRIEQMKREAMGDDALAKREVQEELGKGMSQIEESRKRLKKLIGDGNDLVTSVQVGGDARESERRVIEEEAKRSRIEKLQSEAKTSAEKFDDISKRWSAARMKEIPQDLHDMLKEQTTSCDAVIEEKNKLITILQQEVKQKDDDYVKDLKKQAGDIDLLIERMEEQVKNLTKSYREELRLIEEAYTAGRKDTNQANRKKWDSVLQQRREKEEEHMKMREQRVEEHERQLDQLRTQDAEEYNMVKIKLETDVQILEQQLQQMKATYQLNQEKLEYNFQVLKKRDEENTITKSQQKRKITRLQDVLNNLRIKLGKQEKAFKDENQSLVDDYKRIADQYKELHKKMKHFSATDSKKFHDIWIMNEDEVKDLVKKVLNADRIIHEQQLGLPWSSPDTKFMETHGPLVGFGETKEKTAIAVARDILTGLAKSRLEDSPRKQSLQDDDKSHSHDLSVSTVKSVLELLCDEAGFLVEEKLNKLLRPLEDEERSLIKLDAIFKALSIESEDDINKLAAYFNQYKEKGTGMGSNDHESISGSDNIDGIHPNEVLKILKAFVHENIKPAVDSARARGSTKITSIAERDTSKDEEYWSSMADIVQPQKLKMWDALTQALEKYHKVLSERELRIKETESLKQQNAELRMLLHQYITSEVNRELEIPPTRVLQLEYS